MNPFELNLIEWKRNVASLPDYFWFHTISADHVCIQLFSIVIIKSLIFSAANLKKQFSIAWNGVP